MNSYTIKYLIGGYGSLGRVITDCGYASSYKSFLSRFWSRYDGLLDCVKPVILSLREGNKEIELTKKEKYGY